MITRTVARAWRVAAFWLSRASQRRTLAELDDRRLDDIGVDRQSARQEAMKRLPLQVFQRDVFLPRPGVNREPFRLLIDHAFRPLMTTAVHHITVCSRVEQILTQAQSLGDPD